MFAAGITTGFILGSRAGRQAYDQIKERVQSFTGNPRVQQAAAKVEDVAAAKAPEATARVKQAAQSASQTAKSASDTAKSVADDAKDAGSKPSPTPTTADFSSTDESITPTSTL